MKKMILAIVTLFVVTIAAAQNTTIDIPQYENAIQVNGRAEKKVTPDEIHVAITLVDGDIKNQNVEQLEARMKSEFAALGIDIEKALRVTSMANAPRKRRDVDTRRSYELKVGDAATLGKVFEVLGEMDVKEAGVVRLSHSRIEELRSEVRIEAVKNAQKIATELAGAIGQRIDKAVWIQDNGYYESSPMPVYMTRAAMNELLDIHAAAGGQDLEMQEITLTYNVTVKFILQLNWFQ